MNGPDEPQQLGAERFGADHVHFDDTALTQHDVGGAVADRSRDHLGEERLVTDDEQTARARRDERLERLAPLSSPIPSRTASAVSTARA